LRVLREVILALEAKARTLYPEQLFVIGRNIVVDGLDSGRLSGEYGGLGRAFYAIYVHNEHR
jgi:hypothetical protein